MPTSSSNFGRYANTGGRPVENMGHTTPDIEYSESERPAVPLYPAPYLPAGRFDEHKRANIVLSAGTPVALDAAGSMIPAGTPVGHAFDYTSLDYRTGLPKAKNAATGANITSDTTAVMNSGLGGNRAGFFLQPVGIVSYNAYQFEGYVDTSDWVSSGIYSVDYDNPANFPLHNSMAQPETLVAITCDYTIEVPYIYGRNLLGDAVKIIDTDANEVDQLSATAKSYPFAHDELLDAGTGSAVLGSGIELIFISPSNGTGDTGLGGSGLVSGTAAAMQYRADGTSSSYGTAVNCTTEGYHILYDGTDSGKYIVVKTKGAGDVAGDVGDGFSAGTIVFTGQSRIQPGDFVACRLGKIVKWCPDRMQEGDKLGQVLRVRTSAIKRDYQDRVKTAYNRSSDPTHRMAGSATRGVPYLISLVTDAAQVVYETKKNLDDSTTFTGSFTSTPPLGSIVVNLLR